VASTSANTFAVGVANLFAPVVGVDKNFNRPQDFGVYTLVYCHNAFQFSPNLPNNT
jgi:hypothetical protein